MARHAFLLLRLAAGGLGSATLVVGTVFALSGGDATPTAAPLATIAPAPAVEAAVPAESPTTAATVETATLEAGTPGEPQSTPAAALAGTVPVAAARPAPPPPPAAAKTATPATDTDLPLYKDTQVLAMAASVAMPSGKTFEQCVALGPHGARWPVPVHLYYEGMGKWLVETHLGEVQAEFDEATATFRVKHFAPEGEECR